MTEDSASDRPASAGDDGAAHEDGELPAGAVSASAGASLAPAGAGPSAGRAKASGGSSVKKRPFIRAARAGVATAIIEAAWDELNIPRARIRTVLRRSVGRMRRRPRATALFWGTLAGAVFILYSSGMGAGQGFLAWGAFVAAGVVLAAGGPLAVVHAWPLAIAAVLAGAVWGCAALGAGALWLAAAVFAAVMSLYFAAAGLVPLVAAGGLAYLVWSRAGPSSGRIVWAALVFAAASAALIRFRRRLTAPLLAAGWVLVSGAAAARLGWTVLGDWMPAGWSGGVLPGPPWLGAPVVAGAAASVILVWPRRRRGPGIVA